MWHNSPTFSYITLGYGENCSIWSFFILEGRVWCFVVIFVMGIVFFLYKYSVGLDKICLLMKAWESHIVNEKHMPD